MSETPCPFCGAYSRRSCELEEEMGVCPWEEASEEEEAEANDHAG